MQAAKSAIAPRDVASFAALYAPADELMAAPLIAAAGRSAASRTSCMPMRAPPRRAWR